MFLICESGFLGYDPDEPVFCTSHPVICYAEKERLKGGFERFGPPRRRRIVDDPLLIAFASLLACQGLGECDIREE